VYEVECCCLEYWVRSEATNLLCRCMQPVSGDQYRGMNIAGLVTHGSYLDWLNIMAYDCGKERSD
jgi:hypothetical protein